MIASAIALDTIDDLYSGDDLDDHSEEDRDNYRGVAAFLLAISVMVIVVQLILLIIRLLFFAEIITSHFAVYGIVVGYSYICITVNREMFKVK